MARRHEDPGAPTAASIPPAESVMNGTAKYLTVPLDVRSAHALRQILESGLMRRLADSGERYAREGAELALDYLSRNASREIAVSLIRALAARDFPLNFDNPQVVGLLTLHEGDANFDTLERSRGETLQ